MPIPKKIYQVWHDKIHPFKNYINKVLEMNPTYEYELFGEEEIDKFVLNNYPDEIFKCYNKLNLITAKVDFWRYLFLYKNGGIYIDVDSTFLKPLDQLILNYDAVITREPNYPYEYVQWALFFAPNHPILKKTIDIIVDNIKYNKYPNNILKMTGPYPYTLAIDSFHKEINFELDRNDSNLFSLIDSNKPDYIINYNNSNHRLYGIQYGDYALSWVPEKDSMYTKNNNHWSVELNYKQLLK